MGGSPREEQPLASDVLARCRAGDARAWNELVEHFAALVYSIPKRHGLTGVECDDVFQSVFASLVANLEQLRDDAALPKWLITTAHRATWKAARSRARQGAEHAAIAVEASPAFEEVERLERVQVVRDALQALGQPCRELLELLFVQSVDYQTAGERLGVPPGSLGPTRRRCLAKLEAILRARERTS